MAKRDGHGKEAIMEQEVTDFENRTSVDSYDDRDNTAQNHKIERLDPDQTNSQNGNKGSEKLESTINAVESGQLDFLSNEDHGENQENQEGAIVPIDEHIKPAGFYLAEPSADPTQLANMLPDKLANSFNGRLQYVNEADAEFFKDLIDAPSTEDDKQRKVLRLILLIKNGIAQVRKTAMFDITRQAKTLGIDAIFPVIMPLLSTPGIEEAERHILIKVMSRIMLQLKSDVTPYGGRLLAVIQPLLVSADQCSRDKGREMIASLTRAIGLKSMLVLIRPELSQSDENVRRTVAIALAMVGRTVGVPKIVPFLSAVCRTRESWETRSTGLRAIHHLALVSGSAVLPDLEGLIGSAASCLRDPQIRVRIGAANALTALAEAANPYGIESFEQALDNIWMGVRQLRGKGLAAFIRTLGALVPLMDPESSQFYTQRVLEIAIKEFTSPDEEMQRTVLKVIELCTENDGIDIDYLKNSLLEPFFSSFWLRRLAMDRRSSTMIVKASVGLATKVGASEVLRYILDLNVLKDGSLPFQQMGLRTVNEITQIDNLLRSESRQDALLVDGLVLAIRHSQSVDKILIKTVTSVFTALGSRSATYIDDLIEVILEQFNSPNPDKRQTASLLIEEVAPVVYQTRRQLLIQLGTVLYEQLGEDYPDVLASVLKGLTGVASVTGMSTIEPPISDLLPRLTPILRNRNENVQEACISLVCKIAERGPEYVNAREWIRVCHELLELFKSTRKIVRRLSNDTLGYIAQGIGPQDVLSMLLNNLHVQDRQSRVSTGVAIAIVAEKCEPFTVLPALLNEYQVSDSNVQQSVLKALTFLFQYVGHNGSSYLDSVIPVVDHALTSRNPVHRQTACSLIKSLAAACYGKGQEAVFVHFLNNLLPNIFETAPHFHERIFEAMNAILDTIGVGLYMTYIWPGLFHPARKVREIYWQLYNEAYILKGHAMPAFYPRELLHDE